LFGHVAVAKGALSLANTEGLTVSYDGSVVRHHVYPTQPLHVFVVEAAGESWLVTRSGKRCVVYPVKKNPGTELYTVRDRQDVG
jgi:hypothetical protein